MLVAMCGQIIIFFETARREFIEEIGLQTQAGDLKLIGKWRREDYRTCMRTMQSFLTTTLVSFVLRTMK